MAFYPYLQYYYILLETGLTSQINLLSDSREAISAKAGHLVWQ